MKKQSFVVPRFLRGAAALVALLVVSAALCAVSAADPAPTGSSGTDGGVNIIYKEDFSEIDPEKRGPDLMDALGWKILSKDAGTAIRNNSVSYSVADGKLVLDNLGGGDSYVEMVDAAKMAKYGDGDYTVQYDLTLLEAGDTSRYIVVLHDYREDTKGTYNTFHLRVNGSGNNQARINGDWFTYDDPNGGYFAEDKKDGDGTSTIAKKILGQDYTGGAMLYGIDLTIRVRVAADACGPEVWIRNNSAGGDFVLVSVPSDVGTASPYWRTDSLPGRAIALKAGGSVKGTVDNIVIFSGLGEPRFTADPPATAPGESGEAPDGTGGDADARKGFADFWDGTKTGKYAGWALVALVGVTAGACVIRKKEK